MLRSDSAQAQHIYLCFSPSRGENAYKIAVVDLPALEYIQKCVERSVGNG